MTPRHVLLLLLFFFFFYYFFFAATARFPTIAFVLLLLFLFALCDLVLMTSMTAPPY